MKSIFEKVDATSLRYSVVRLLRWLKFNRNIRLPYVFAVLLVSFLYVIGVQMVVLRTSSSRAGHIDADV